MTSAICLACGADLHLTADGWADENGSTQCPRRAGGHQVEQVVPDQVTYDPSWVDHKDVVTPDDIRRVHQQALDAGGNPDDLNHWLRCAIRDAGGSIEDLARQWTAQNRFQRDLAAYSAQLDRARKRPRLR
ncbi:hypothetical protein ACBJ59_12055 [Nonomuraea sp. MTCD27]|uniref:hypothetical protein n=1 Tax=Nonomuraea sp. MTCD27 TaxID=1676747 RepID=UPI0035BFF9C4